MFPAKLFAEYSKKITCEETLNTSFKNTVKTEKTRLAPKNTKNTDAVMSRIDLSRFLMSTTLKNSFVKRVIRKNRIFVARGLGVIFTEIFPFSIVRSELMRSKNDAIRKIILSLRISLRLLTSIRIMLPKSIPRVEPTLLKRLRLFICLLTNPSSPNLERCRVIAGPVKEITLPRITARR
jgi:hypothetical protein